MDAVVGRVAALWRHPVKSMQGEQIDRVEVLAHGIAGDRAYGVRDGLTGRVLSAKREPQLLHATARYDRGAVLVTLPSGEERAVEDPALDLALTEWLGRPVSVVAASLARHSRDPFVDVSAVHLMTTASLLAGRSYHPAGAWDLRRFRPNLLVEAAGSGHVEDGWVGGTVRIGEAVLSLVERTIRCPMTTWAQPGLDEDAGILAATTARNERRLGVYADVGKVGWLDDGARVEWLTS